MRRRRRTAVIQSASRLCRRVAILAVPPINELDVVGPFQVFGTVNRLFGGGGPLYEIAGVNSWSRTFQSCLFSSSVSFGSSSRISLMLIALAEHIDLADRSPVEKFQLCRHPQIRKPIPDSVRDCSASPQRRRQQASGLAHGSGENRRLLHRCRSRHASP